MGVSGLSLMLNPQFGKPKSKYSIILSEQVASQGLTIQTSESDSLDSNLSSVTYQLYKII